MSPHVSDTRSSSVVETSNGHVCGAQVDGVHMFRGIPYGGPTEGSARFMPPSKPEPWSGVRDATNTGARCIQPPGGIFLVPGLGEYFGGGRADRVELAQEPSSENCLVLNVLTPAFDGKRPVMVYIHGGGFFTGSAMLTLFSDQFVREQNVVLVGINHRLNVFGYTYLGGLSDHFSVGNVGQLDLVAALEWVRDNIAQFGGDPSNVTIFGESGGGAKISALMAMPAAQGLFHKAIVESGSMLRVAEPGQATEQARMILAELGLGSDQLEALQAVPAQQLFEASGKVLHASGSPLGMGPVIDGQTILAQTWDPQAPAISAGVPMLIGNCKDESTLFARQDPSVFSLDEDGLRAGLVEHGIPADKVGDLLALYQRDHPTESPSDLYFRISTDRGARRNAAMQAELQIANQANVFVYSFGWNTPLEEGKMRAFHTAELPLAMRLVQYPEAENLSRQISGAWAAFARHGDPSQPGLEWPNYTLDERATMIFDAAQSSVVKDPDRDERLFLRDYPSGSLL